MKFTEELQQEENFIKLYKFTCSLPKEQSYMLSYLIDAEDFITEKMPDDSSYFKCNKEGFIQNLLTGWTKYEIDRAIKDLEKAGYLTYISKNDGLKRCSYIKLNYTAIDNLNEKYKKSKVN